MWGGRVSKELPERSRMVRWVRYSISIGRDFRLHLERSKLDFSSAVRMVVLDSGLMTVTDMNNCQWRSGWTRTTHWQHARYLSSYFEIFERLTRDRIDIQSSYRIEWIMGRSVLISWCSYDRNGQHQCTNHHVAYTI